MSSDSLPVGHPPGRDVLEAFGITGVLVPLPGGTTGRCYRAGELVLKPDQDEQVVAWMAQLADTVTDGAGFRLTQPVVSRSGRWTVSGWAATPFMEGEHEHGRWSEMLRAGQALHFAVEHLPKPDFLDARTHRWAVGDRAAWGELEVKVPDELRGEVATLSSMIAPVDARSQVVHSDLCGNTLVHEHLPPAIIDFSALFRPAAYAEAILVSDAVIWESAPLSLVEDWTLGELERQMLIRACLFRLYTAAVGWPDMPEWLTIIQEHHAPLTEWLRTRAAPSAPPALTAFLE